MDVQVRTWPSVLIPLGLAAVIFAAAALGQNALPPPSGLTAEVSPDGRGVLIKWSPLDAEYEVKGYNIYRGPDADRMGMVAAMIAETEFRDTGIGPNIPSYYRVEAIGLEGPGAGSVVGPIMISSMIEPPSPAADLVAFDSPFDSGHSIHVVWGASADDDAGKYTVTGYDVFRADDSGLRDKIWVGSMVSGEFGSLKGYVLNACQRIEARTGVNKPEDADRYLFVDRIDDKTKEDDPRYVKNGTPYYYEILAKVEGVSAPSATSEPVSVAPPKPAAWVEAQPGEHGGVDVTWQKSPDDGLHRQIVESYQVYRGASAAELDAATTPLADVEAHGGLEAKEREQLWVDQSAQIGIPYYYKVVAVTTGAASEVNPATKSAAKASGDYVPPVPEPVRRLRATMMQEEIHVEWTMSKSDDHLRRLVSGYIVERSIDGGGSWQSLQEEPLKPGTKSFLDGKLPYDPSTDVSVIYRVTPISKNKDQTLKPPDAENPVTKPITLLKSEAPAPAEQEKAAGDEGQQPEASGQEAAAGTPAEAGEVKAAVMPVSDLVAEDVKGDFGSRILVSFKASPEESATKSDEEIPAITYEIMRSELRNDDFEPITVITGERKERYFYLDQKNVRNGVPFYYRIYTVRDGIKSESVANEDSPAVALADSLPPDPPSNVKSEPFITDASAIKGRVRVRWDLSPDDGPNPAPGHAAVTGYDVYRANIKGEEFGAYQLMGRVPAGTTEFLDRYTSNRTSYAYRVVAVSSKYSEPVRPAEAVKARPQWFDLAKLPYFIIMVVISFAIIFFIEHAKKGRKMFIRKIAGLEAVDDAIGRATEMGKNILFVPGIMDINDVQTLAALTILARIAKTIAEHDTVLKVPTSKSLVMTTAREVVKEAFLEAGRPDAYNVDHINYLTDDQFGYVAGVTGMMVREKPATCFFLGSFYAESLILAETGNLIGAIQIAGTAQPAQLPFFIAACDYTLIGEELFAASAYLSGEPRQLGSLKGQDIGKAIAMIGIVFGSVIETISVIILANNPTSTNFLVRFAEWFKNLFALPS